MDHKLTVTEVYYSGSYHKVGCPDCTGYVLQAHNNGYTYTYVNATTHTRTYNCCGANNTQGHTAASSTATSSAKHTLYFSCCDKSVAENHSSSATYTYTAYSSATSHRVSRSCCSGYYTAPHTFNTAGLCTLCGYSSNTTAAVEEVVEQG